MKTFYRVICAAAAICIGLGVLMGGVGFAMGGRPYDLMYSDGGWHRGWSPMWGSGLWGSDTVEASYTGVTKLEFDLGLSEVEIRQGDEFSVKAQRVNAKQFRTWQDGSTWKIECPNNEQRGWNRSYSGKNAPFITITLPKGFVAEELELEMGMGSLTADGLAARESGLFVGMGEMVLKNFTSGDCDMEVGMGTMEITGLITGRSTINCGMGTAELKLSGNADEYGYTATVGMGSVTVGGESVGGLGGDVSRNTGAANRFDIDCGMGTVEITFR